MIHPIVAQKNPSYVVSLLVLAAKIIKHPSHCGAHHGCLRLGFGSLIEIRSLGKARGRVAVQAKKTAVKFLSYAVRLCAVYSVHNPIASED